MKPTLATATSLIALLMLLSACGMAPMPEAEPLTGVDEIGPYTVVAQSGDGALSAQGTKQTMPTRVIQVREYSGLRYRAVLTVKFPRYTEVGSLRATVGVVSKSASIGMDSYVTAERDARSPTALSVASKVKYVPRKTANGFPITSICGLADDGVYWSTDGSGNYHYEELAEFYAVACYVRN